MSRPWHGKERRGYKYYNPEEFKDRGYQQHHGPTGIKDWLMVLAVFVVITVCVIVGLFLLLGWVKLCVFGDMTTGAYLERLTYDLTHLNDPNSYRRLQYVFHKIFRA